MHGVVSSSAWQAGPIGGHVTRVWARLAFGDARFPDARLGASLPFRGTVFYLLFLFFLETPIFGISGKFPAQRWGRELRGISLDTVSGFFHVHEK